MSFPPSASLPLSRIAMLFVTFLVVVLLAYGIAQGIQSIVSVPLGIGRWFPVAYGHPRTPSLPAIAIALLTIGAFAGMTRLLPFVSKRYQYTLAALIGFLAILATTATHGVDRGFNHPIAGRDPHAKPAQYWHDAESQKIRSSTDAMRFVQDYRSLQPTLAEHGRTHPPGAVLFFALLRQLSGNRPAFAAVLLCLIAVTLIATGFRLANAPPFALLLFCALPAVQLYYCATLDAIIAGLLFLTLISACTVRSPLSPSDLTGLFLPFLSLLTASFLTFGVVWVVPVLLSVEIARTRRFPWQTMVLLVAIVLSYGIVYVLTGFDYLAAFRFASHNENPEGFRLFVNPVEYLATRVENIGDLVFFTGPFVLWAMGRGLAIARREAFPQWTMFLAGVCSLALLFLAGAYRTGETARACLFLYPLIVLVASRVPLSESERTRLLIATLCLSTVLQCVGFYFW